MYSKIPIATPEIIYYAIFIEICSTNKEVAMELQEQQAKAIVHEINQVLPQKINLMNQ